MSASVVCVSNKSNMHAVHTNLNLLYYADQCQYLCMCHVWWDRYKLDPALGVFEQKVICVPDVATYARRTGPGVRGDGLMLACDGIFEVCSNEEAVDR